MQTTNSGTRHSFRLSCLWGETGKERLGRILALLDRYPGAADELAMFTSDTHSPLPLDTLRQRAADLAARMEEGRAHGYSCGINHLVTVGHHPENRGRNHIPHVGSTNIFGEATDASLCMNDPENLEYVREEFRILAAARPEFIWIDDDVRFGHMPNDQGCFCDGCLTRFAEETGLSHTRESLWRAFNEGPEADRLAVRRLWLEHNRKTIARLFGVIRAAVDEAVPGLPLGFMTGERYFEGYDFARWSDALSGKGRVPLKWRPGGGAYDDHVLRGFQEKSHDMGRQVSRLPAYVTDIQAEIESFPYQHIDKGAQATAMEASFYIAAGCTGTAFNVLPMYEEPFEAFDPLLRAIQERRPFYDRLVRTLGRAPSGGIQLGWNADSYILTGLPEGGDWPNTFDYGFTARHANELFELGFPPAFCADEAAAAALSGESVKAMSREEILRVLSGGVYLDAAALDALNEMGYGNLMGFRVAGRVPADALERFVAHPFNGESTGFRRNGRQAFYSGDAAFFDCAPGAEILAELVNYQEERVADCCMGVFENGLGGRVCAAGYYPWRILKERTKSDQLKRVFRWLANGRLPSWVESYRRCCNWTRLLPDGRVAVVLANASLDPAEGIRLRIRTASDWCVFTRNDGNSARLRADAADGGERTFVLPPLGAWEECLCVTE